MFLFKCFHTEVPVPSQENERSCICVLGLSSHGSERSCICVLGLSSQGSERSCIFVLGLSSLSLSVMFRLTLWYSLFVVLLCNIIALFNIIYLREMSIHFLKILF